MLPVSLLLQPQSPLLHLPLELKFQQWSKKNVWVILPVYKNALIIHLFLSCSSTSDWRELGDWDLRNLSFFCSQLWLIGSPTLVIWSMINLILLMRPQTELTILTDRDGDNRRIRHPAGLWQWWGSPSSASAEKVSATKKREDFNTNQTLCTASFN